MTEKDEEDQIGKNEHKRLSKVLEAFIRIKNFRTMLKAWENFW